MSPVILPDGILNLLVRIWRHLSRRRRRQFWLVLGLMLISAFAEIVSLGAVLPFLGILIEPERVFSNPLATGVVQALDITSADQLVLPLTLAFIALALMAGGIRIFLLWVSTRLAYACATDFSVDVYERTLYQPYRVHVSRSSNEVISAITQKVDHVVAVLSSLLLFISSVVLLGAIMSTLVAIDPQIAFIAATGFGLIYGLVTWLIRHRLRKNSQRIAREETQVVKALQEGLGGIRDVLLDGTQRVYCNIFLRAQHPLKRAWGNNLFIGGSPRFAMEAMGITLISSLAYGLSIKYGGLSTILPTLGALVLGMQRLLPALQQGYSAWTVIIGSHDSIADVIELLDQPLPAEELEASLEPLHFEDSILFENVYFRYSSDGPWVLDGLNLTIPKGARVGFVGSTGSGKSTTLDLLMGLLFPTEGKLLVDGQNISGNRIRAWQRSIAHVPQSIYLADSTIAENIAFGVPLEDIDLGKVKQAAQMAQIAEFIESRPEGYNAFVGERGIRISGGQRQRIGIARALYKQATVLVFDEATSALDNETERSVMRAIKELNSNFTILLIAHRLTTIQDCDVILELEHGKVVAQGTYEYLLENSPTFRQKAFVSK
jgi:ABC-type multidrug transport system fused ATPase/permease subunit